MHRLLPLSAAVTVLAAAVVLAAAAAAFASPATDTVCVSGAPHAPPDCPDQIGGAFDNPLSIINSPGTDASVTFYDPCVSMGWNHRVSDHDHGLGYHYYYVWGAAQRAWEPMILTCQTAFFHITGKTTGPGSGGVHVPCPRIGADDRQTRPASGGAALFAEYTDPDVVDRPAQQALRQVGGGFGRHDDGFWSYRFDNKTGHEVKVRLWGLCRYED
jgi:hypothetical protein